MLGLLLIGSAYAQDRRISGIVTSADDGTALSGVSVSAVGTNQVTSTDDDGNYSIVVGANVTSLEFRSLGFTSQTVTIGARSIINISLRADATALSEVVVTGYGTVQRQNFVGNAATVSGAQVANVPAQSFDQVLGGKAAGAQISIPNGVVGNPPVIRIRGTNSISLSSYPLIVIDGVPTFTGDYSGSSSAVNPLSSINPSDIESIDVLKDASATAIYGSRASNGVLIITTKKGRSGTATLNYDSWVSVNQAQRLPEIMNAREFVETKNEGLINAGTYNPLTNSYNLDYDADGNLIETDWLDYVYRNGYSHNHSLSIRGGTDQTSYYGSVVLSDQEGIIIGNDYEKLGGMFNIDHRFAKDIFKVGAKLNATNEKTYSFTGSGSLPGQAFSVTGLGRLALVSHPNVSPYNADGSYNLSGNALGNGANTAAGAGYYNVAVLRDHNRTNSYTRRMQGNFYLQADPLPWLSLKTLYGIDNFDVDDDLFLTHINGDGFAQGGYATRQLAQYRRWVWTNTADLTHQFEGGHNVHALLGNEQTRSKGDSFWTRREGLSDTEFEHIGAGFINPFGGGGYNENYLVSFFGALNYDFNRKYFLNASVRHDEYSAFGPNNKGGTFFSVGGAYAISNESFYEESNLANTLSTLRLRGSYGTVGNNNGLNWLAPNSLYEYRLYGETPSLAPSSAGNLFIAWEVSKKLDLGVNLGFLNDKVTVDAAYYRNDIQDLIYQVPQAPSAGLISNPNVNVGSMYNAGVELTVNVQAVQKENFSWDPSFNITFNKNEVTALSEGVTQFTSANSDLETASITRVGGPLGQIYAVRTDGVDPATGRRIFINGDGERVFYDHSAPQASRYTYADGSPASALGTNDHVAYANSMPRYFGGFSNNFRYKNFDLMANFTFQLDYSIYWGTRAGLFDNRTWNSSVENLNRWTTPGQQTDVPRIVNGDNVSNGSAFPITANVFKGDFLKLRDLAFGYTIPNTALDRVGISNLRIYVSAHNAFIFTKYPGTDPEVSSNGNSNTAQGMDRNSVATGRSFMAGINLSF